MYNREEMLEESLREVIEANKETVYTSESDIGTIEISDPQDNNGREFYGIYERKDEDCALEIHGSFDYQGKNITVLASAYLEEKEVSDLSIRRIDVGGRSYINGGSLSNGSIYKKLTDEGFSLPIQLMLLEESSRLWIDFKDKNEIDMILEKENHETLQDIRDNYGGPETYKN